MEKRLVKITVSKNGEYKMEALEGFVGQDCINKTKDIELVLGGQETGAGKTDKYFEDDGDNPNFINNVL